MKTGIFREILWRKLGGQAKRLVCGCLGLVGGALPAFSESSSSGLTNGTATVYDADPKHLWNRLFAAFYSRAVEYNDRTNPDLWKKATHPPTLGPVILDPPLGVHPRFLLDNGPFK